MSRRCADSLTGLTSLSLSFSCGSQSIAALQPLSGLCFLDIEAWVEPAHFSNLTSLTGLQVNTYLELADICALRSLRQLSLPCLPWARHMNIDKPELQQCWEGLQSLTVLNVQLADHSFSILTKLPALRRLYIFDAIIGNGHDLYACQALQALHISLDSQLPDLINLTYLCWLHGPPEIALPPAQLQQSLAGFSALQHLQLTSHLSQSTARRMHYFNVMLGLLPDTLTCLSFDGATDDAARARTHLSHLHRL